MNHSLNIEDFELDEIVSIESAGDLPTIDISVEDTHMFFLGNGVYAHNSGYNAEIVTMESISEAFNKCFVADFIFTLSRTLEDKNANSGRFFVAKNRFGPDGLVYPIEMDTSKVKVRIVNNVSGSLGTNPAKTQEQILREKYKELMGKNNGTSK